MAGLPEHEQRAWDAIVADLSGQIDLGLDNDARPAVVDDEVDEGYVPPVPPPLPRPRDAIARFSWAAALGGPIVVVATSLLGWETWITGLAVAASIAGFASLLARMNDRDDDGNGAVV